jgi:hypothetical protein
MVSMSMFASAACRPASSCETPASTAAMNAATISAVCPAVSSPGTGSGQGHRLATRPARPHPPAHHPLTDDHDLCPAAPTRPSITKSAHTSTADQPTQVGTTSLWIRAVGADREWRLLSFAFQAEFLPVGAHLWQDGRLGKELQVTDNDVKRQTDQWIKVLREDKTFVPYRHDDGTVEADERRSTGGLRR